MAEVGSTVRRLVPLLLIACVLLAGCATTPPAAPAALPPSSIALTPAQIASPGAWTTPPAGAPTLLRRTPAPSVGTNLGSAEELPIGLITNPQNPTFGTPGVGAGRERRLEQDMATAGPWEVIVTGVSTYIWGGDLETGGDGPDEWWNNVRVAFEKPLDYYGRFGFVLSYANRQYMWSGSNDLIGGTDRPFENVHTLRANVNLFQPVSRSSVLVATFTATLSAADGADLADGFSWAVTAGGGHRFSPKFDAGLGVLISDGFGESLFIIGGPQFDWRPSDQWQISLQGTQLDVAYKPTKQWEVGATGSFLGVRFRLPDDAPGDRPGGIVGESRLPIYLWARYRGREDFDLELRAGVDVWRYFTIEDRNGHAEYSVEMDPAPFVGLRAIWRL